MNDIGHMYKNSDADFIYNNIILGNDIWYYDHCVELKTYASSSRWYDDFKRTVSQKLDVHLGNVCVVGSAKTGYSMKGGIMVPFKMTEDNDDPSKKASDFDIAVVCDKKFGVFWNILLDMCCNGRYIKDYPKVSSSVMRKFMRTDVIPESYEEVKVWNSKVDSLMMELQTRYFIFHKKSIRLYESWDGLKNYQIGSINKIKNNIRKMEEGIANENRKQQHANLANQGA